MSQAIPDPSIQRKVRRKAIFGYGYLVTPGFALLGLALFDAIAESRWYVFASLTLFLIVFLFYLPLVSHFRCTKCRRFFHYQKLGLESGDTVYRCVECGHTKHEREWCGMTDIVKSSRCLPRRKYPYDDPSDPA
ncbi:MAG: hypothetical protein GKS02_11565 [Alphaproteobacteria bacterium]|nr:hypothetical protein [Alphaproteobacteria bacterium]